MFTWLDTVCINNWSFDSLFGARVIAIYIPRVVLLRMVNRHTSLLIQHSGKNTSMGHISINDLSTIIFYSFTVHILFSGFVYFAWHLSFVEYCPKVLTFRTTLQHLQIKSFAQFISLLT